MVAGRLSSPPVYLHLTLGESQSVLVAKGKHVSVVQVRWFADSVLCSQTLILQLLLGLLPALGGQREAARLHGLVSYLECRLPASQDSLGASLLPGHCVQLQFLKTTPAESSPCLPLLAEGSASGNLILLPLFGLSPTEASGL